VPWWAVVSAVVAPVAMIGGWTVAAAQQQSFDPVSGTISALATQAVESPWIMTLGLAATGVAHVATAAGLRSVPRRARAVHALGGAATLAVALLPVDASPQAHGVAAGIGFVALALWPALSGRRDGPAVLRPAVGVAASVVLVTLLVVFVAELQRWLPGDGSLTGLTERLVAGAQALWPLVVVTALRRAVGRPPSGGRPAPP